MVDDGVGLGDSIDPSSAGSHATKPGMCAARPIQGIRSLEDIDDIIGRIIGRQETERLAAQYQAKESGFGWPGEPDTSSDPTTSSAGASSGPPQNSDASMNISYYSAPSDVDNSGHSEPADFFEVPSPAQQRRPSDSAFIDATTDVPAVIISPPPSGGVSPFSLLAARGSFVAFGQHNVVAIF
jgi:hypothetical protein